MISSPLITTRLDGYTSAVNPMWSRSPRGTIVAITPLTPTASSIAIRVNRAWQPHQPGQFVTVGVDVAGIRQHRCYSITSAPGGDIVEIAVQRVDGGVVSTHLTRDARVGDLVGLSQPDGDFTLPSFTPDKLLFVTGGSGITPVMGMLRSLVGRPPHTDVVVLHHAPTPLDTMFAGELAMLGAVHDWITVHVTHTRAGGSRLDADRLNELCPDWADRDVFVCGPAPLIEFATDHWSTAGELDRLHLERFTLSTPSVAVDAEGGIGPAGSTALLAKSGLVAAVSGSSTLLEAVEDAGVIAPYGCRSGVCHTCSTRLISGCTQDVRDGRISEAGTHVQLCISRPIDDVTLDI